MKLRVVTQAFKSLLIEGIDPSTLSFYGPINGYSASDNKDYSSISFVAYNAVEQVEKIRKSFQLNPEHNKVEDYISVRTEFEEYRTDKRPRITIRLDNGLRGMRNPPEFHFGNE